MKTEKKDGVTVAYAPGRIDATTAGPMETELSALISAGERKIVCDFSGNEYISSAGLRALLGALKLMQKQGGKLVLASLSPFAREVLEMAGFIALFTVYDEAGQAVRDLA